MIKNNYKCCECYQRFFLLLSNTLLIMTHNPVKGNSFIPQDDRIASVLPIQLKVLRGTRVIKVANKLKCTLFSNGARGTVVRVHSKDNSTSVNVTGVSVVCWRNQTPVCVLGISSIYWDVISLPGVTISLTVIKSKMS